MKPHFLSRFLFLFSLILASSTPASAFSVVNLTNYHQIELPKSVVGPESIAFDCRGKGPYVGVSDGRILKWQGPCRGWTEFAFTSPTRPRKICDGSTDNTTEPICGRPLGLKFNPKTCELYIADAYFGLLKIGRNGGRPQQLATSLNGVPFRFLNALDIDSQTGIVYFTDTSTAYQRRLWPLSIATGDKTGRLLQYDPCTKKVTVLLDNLAFANGVALSKDSSFLLVAESATFKIFKFWLRGPKAHDAQLFTQLKRPADNIKRTNSGEFWAALNSRRGLQGNQTSPSLWLTKDPVGVKFDEQGNVMEVLDGEGGPTLESISEVEEHNGKLWIGSVVKSYVGVIKS
ncbi:protein STRICTOSIDINE SYNTHASE-LIKE 10 [Rosa sericea]